MKSYKSPLLMSLLLAFAVQAEELYLKDGTILQGERIRLENNMHTQVFRTQAMGEIWIPVDQILEKPIPPPVVVAPKIEPPAPVLLPEPVAPPAPVLRSAPAVPRVEEKEGTDPSNHSLVFMPTAFTLPVGTWSFEDFELLFLTMSYAVTSTTQITGGMLFPVDPNDFEAFTFGAKQQLLETPDHRTAMAITGSFTDFSGDFSREVLSTTWTVNLVGSVAFQGVDGAGDIGGVHIAMGDMGSTTKEQVYDYSSYYSTSRTVTKTHNSFSLFLGSDIRISPNAKFIVEYLRGGEFNGDSDFQSILNFGFRIHGQHLSADICGFRSLEVDMGNIFLLPMINIGYTF